MAEEKRGADRRYDRMKGKEDSPAEEASESDAERKEEGDAPRNEAEREEDDGARKMAAHDEMRKRHEKEMRDLHGTTREAMRKMHQRHADEYKSLMGSEEASAGGAMGEAQDEGAAGGSRAA